MDSNTRDPSNGYPDSGYALSGKIMLSAIVILFFVVILMVCLHLYARWYLLRARRRQIRRARTRRSQMVFYVDPANPNGNLVTVPAQGLDAAVMKSLPVFLYSEKTHPDSIECAVCLSEFEENETGRTLPKCNHSFHIECIDMWFHSHSTCPICRSPVEPLPETPAQAASSSETAEIDSTSDLCSTCHHEEAQIDASTSSFSGRRKPVELIGVTIEVPRRNGGFDGDSGIESPGSRSYRSPMSRMLSFKRMLSRENRKGSVSPSSCGGAVSEVVIDIEGGGDSVDTVVNRR